MTAIFTRVRNFLFRIMGRKCFVPNCKTGYKSQEREGKKISLFKAPSDKELLLKWQKAIPRRDRALSDKDHVCELHFPPDLVLKEWTAKSGSAVIMQIPTRAKLDSDAVPTIFPGCPSYLSKRETNRRNPPAKRKGTLLTSSSKCKSSKIDHTEQLLPASPSDLPSTSLKDVFLSPEMISLPSKHWNYRENKTEFNKYVTFFETGFTREGLVVGTKQLILFEDERIKVNILHNNVDVIQFKSELRCLEDLQDLINGLAEKQICSGGPPGNQFRNIKLECGKIDLLGVWRHNKCELLVEDGICSKCTTMENTLRIHEKRQAKKTEGIKRFRLPRKTHVPLLKKAIKNQRRTLKYRNSIINKLKLELKLVREEFIKINENKISEYFENSNVPLPTQLMIKECIEAGRRSAKSGRRYTGDWLLLCLLLHIRSPKGYNFLRDNDILPLPSVKTVRKYLSLVDTGCGFDLNFFTALKLKIEKKRGHEKHGILSLDEMQVRKSISINSRTMTYSGLLDNGEQAKNNNEMADHALVFMFQAFADSRAQPIATFGSCGPTRAIVLTQLILQAISLLENAGAIVDGIVADGATTNRGVWKELGVSGKIECPRNFFQHPLHDNRKVYVFSDAPHLFKCIRNRLLHKKLFVINGMHVKWTDYENLFAADTQHPLHLRVCPKLTSSHIYPYSPGEKMRVKYMSQLFSNATASGLKYYSRRNIKGLEETEGTIEFTLMMNNVFDALNRKFPAEGIRINSPDFDTLEKGLAWLNSWEKELSTGRICEDNFLTRSTAQGLRVTLMSTIALAEYLLHPCDFDYVLSAKFNQDSLEKFFGIIRAVGGQNDHPTMPTFLQLYKMLSVYSLLKPPKFGNCEARASEEKPYITFEDFKNTFTYKDNTAVADLKKKLDSLINEESWECDDVIEHDYGMAEVVECIIYYVSGFVARHFSKFLTCLVCKGALMASEVNPISNFPVADLVNCKTRGKLVHPNIHLHKLLSTVEHYLAQNITSPSVFEDTLFDLIENHQFSFPCAEHKEDIVAKMVHYYILLRMRQYCKQKNSTLGLKTKEKRKQSKLYMD